MLSYAVIFFIIALVAAALGFGGIAANAAGIAKILFVVFLVLAIASFVLNAVSGHPDCSGHRAPGGRRTDRSGRSGLARSERAQRPPDQAPRETVEDGIRHGTQDHVAGGDRRRIAALFLQHQLAGGIGSFRPGACIRRPDRDHDDAGR